ncbi:MAG: TrbI/VirB10 family protein [Acidobacteria bacterium]|nr:TrbI/VirB10 family protein [Acidobacteriota bacterium]
MRSEPTRKTIEGAKEPNPDLVDKADLNTEEDDDIEEEGKTGWRESFRSAFERSWRQRKHRPSLQEQARDRTRSLIGVLAMGAALLFLFFVFFSTPSKPKHFGESSRRPNLGRKVTPGEESHDSGNAVTPMLSADVHSTDPALGGQVTPDDVSRTSRTGHPAKPSPSRPSSEAPDYALSRIDFSDPTAGKTRIAPPPPPPPASRPPEEPDLKKPSLVFVHATETQARGKPAVLESGEEETIALPAGTRLLARLEAPVSSAAAIPVTAVIEYNYERDGQIVMPAGARVLGRLTQASPSGDVAIDFNRLELPDGNVAKLEASAMDLNFRPLKGYVSGKRTGRKFLVRSLTGLGTVASYLVGPEASGSAGLISTNALLRQRVADNVATAGQEELNGLALNQNLIVTVPGNTRFYVVLHKATGEHVDRNPVNRNAGLNNAGVTGAVPSLEELRQLLQLRREINELYRENSSYQPAPSP